MRGFILRGCIGVFALWSVAAAVPNVTVEGVGAWLGSALTIGLTNGSIRTAIVFYVLPLSIKVIGPLFLVLNAVLLAVLALIFAGVEFAGIAAALVGWLAIAGASTLATWCIGPEGRFRSLVATRDR